MQMFVPWFCPLVGLEAERKQKLVSDSLLADMRFRSVAGPVVVIWKEPSYMLR